MQRKTQNFRLTKFSVEITLKCFVFGQNRVLHYETSHSLSRKLL
jgi:hypothetical protein